MKPITDDLISDIKERLNHLAKQLKHFTVKKKKKEKSSN